MEAQECAVQRETQHCMTLQALVVPVHYTPLKVNIKIWLPNFISGISLNQCVMMFSLCI